MILGDLISYNKSKYFFFILLFIAINTILHPLTAGYIPENPDRTLNYGLAFSNNLITFGISFNIFGFILGAGLSAFKRSNEPVRIKTARVVLKTIFWMQLILACIHVIFFTQELLSLLF